MKNINYMVKIALMGDPKVGKTALRHRFLGMGFTETYMPTLGADFSIKDYEIEDKVVRVSILDLAGQRNFQVLREQYFKGVSGVLLVFDVTKPYNSAQQIHPWVQEILDYTNQQGVPLAILGNKIDCQFLRMIQGYTGKNAIDDIEGNIQQPVEYFETSAKLGTGVTKAFGWLIEQIVLKFNQ